MSFSFTIKHPLRSILWSAKKNYLYNATLAIAGSLLLAFSAQLVIPLTPVPITLQSATVLFIGMIYGWRLGLATIILYLLEGACGLPVFAGLSFGISTLFGPTGGYLLGFIFAVAITGYLMQNGWAKNIFGAFFSAFLGTTAIFICGFLGLIPFVGMHNAYLYGVKPFLLIEPIKLIVLAIVAPKFWKSNAH